MPHTNNVSFTLSEEELNDINSALDTLERILLPKTISLTPEIRHELLKMGDKTIAFVEKSLEYGEQNHQFVPQFVDLEEAWKDLNGVKTIRTVDRRIDVLSQRLDDTRMQAGSEAYSASRSIYGQIQLIAKATHSVEAQKARDELKARFMGRSAKPNEQETVSA
ncbi:MAG: hypothetical protein GX625_11310 [Clostridiaceae bacterium]|nr:hypothetical protein [Clostridiaceae bacterium]